MRYAFDNLMARGTAALVSGLFLTTAALVLLIAIFVLVTGAARGAEHLGFGTIVWRTLLRAMDAGTVGGDTGSAPFLASMFAVTIGGIFVFSALIGVISTGLEAKLADMRKGRSRVLERDHIVILGWSPQIFAVLGELVTANASQRRTVIAVLADRDKVEMEDEIRARLGSAGRTRVICRKGRPTDLDEIDIVNIQTSRAILVLSPEGDDPDPEVLKILLAIVNDPNRRPEPYHVVAEIRNPANLDVARIVGRDEVELLLVDDLIARITAQTCRQSGLSLVYTELLDFDGDEIYFAHAPALAGRTFGDALGAYERSAVIGIHNGSARLNPPMDTVIGDGDRLIVIAEDDSAIGTPSASAPAIAADRIASGSSITPAAERTLILGWNRRASAVIRELDNYVAPGSTVSVVADDPGAEGGVGELAGRLRNTKLSFSDGDTTERSMLDELGIASFDHVIVLCYSDSEEAERADSRTLITLLQLRDIASKAGAAFSITSEMIDARNRPLAEVTKADDFIVSDRLVSLLMAQVAENKGLGSVFSDLFDAEGSEVYLKPIGNYVTPGAVDFYTVIDAAKRRGEIAIGYRRAALSDDGAKSYGVVVNPRKSDAVNFESDDRVIVLASD
jgi:voltage-gated potassium channel Kch